MADAVCGPSNPLQQFRKQTQLDRTLQQDRLSNRPLTSQGFRTPNPHQGLLDPEFEAFQAGISTPELASQSRAFTPLQPQPSFSPQESSAPSWATDFQRMHISPPPPQQQQQFRNTPSPSTADWAQGFQQHMSMQIPQQASPSTFQVQQRQWYGPMNGIQFAHQQPALVPETQLLGKGKEPVLQQFDEAAFELAFDQAAQDIFRVAEADTEAYALQDAIMTRQDAANVLSQHDETALHGARDARLDEQLGDQFNIALEPPLQHLPDVLQEEKSAEERAQEDDDALARTARDLLGKVEHNQTDKFKNSQFLELMRRLADREVKVEGDKMVETGTSLRTATSSTVSASEQISASNFASKGPAAQYSAPPPLFDNSEQRPSPLSQQVPHPRWAGTASLQPTTAADSLPYDFTYRTRGPEQTIPFAEQDHDSGRSFHDPTNGVVDARPEDGQDVVDLLQQPGAPADEIGTPLPPNPTEADFDMDQYFANRDERDEFFHTSIYNLRPMPPSRSDRATPGSQ